MRTLLCLLMLAACGPMPLLTADGGPLVIGEAEAVIREGSRVACVYAPHELGICSCGERLCGTCACPRTVAEGGCMRGDVGFLAVIECR